MKLKTINNTSFSKVEEINSIELMDLNESITTLNNDLTLMDAANYYANKYGKDNPIIQDIFGNILAIGNEGAVGNIVTKMWDKFVSIITTIVTFIKNFFAKIFGKSSGETEATTTLKKDVLVAKSKQSKVEAINKNIDASCKDLVNDIKQAKQNKPTGNESISSSQSEAELKAALIKKAYQIKDITMNIVKAQGNVSPELMKQLHKEIGEFNGMMLKMREELEIPKTRLHNYEKLCKYATHLSVDYSAELINIVNQIISHNPPNNKYDMLVDLSPYAIANTFINTDFNKPSNYGLNQSVSIWLYNLGSIIRNLATQARNKEHNTNVIKGISLTLQYARFAAELIHQLQYGTLKSKQEEEEKLKHWREKIDKLKNISNALKDNPKE